MLKEFDQVGFGGGKNTINRLSEVFRRSMSTIDRSMLDKLQDTLDLEVEEWHYSFARLNFILRGKDDKGIFARRK
ncbi:MAG TPA: hypothetical protein VK205_10740 [Prolixibacteraceae bacterium]|nr:hypothetical protein [Prolixibacteraceae bacterium]